MIDLHLHSNCSDGVLSPSEVVKMAVQTGLQTIALCDHDSIAGISEAMQAAETMAVEVIPGVELSVCFAEFTDVHLLGYCFDLHATELRERLHEFAVRRSNRNREIVAAVNCKLIQQKRVPLDLAEVEQLANGVMGRPHIARALLQREYVSSMEEAFQRYLIPCDVPKTYWPMVDALATLKRIGGVAVLAHPTSITHDLGLLSKLIGQLQQAGLDGIEVYNSLATEYEMTVLQRLASSLGLLATGGSDYHGIEPNDQMGKGRGGIRFPDTLLPPLRRRALEKQAAVTR